MPLFAWSEAYPYHSPFIDPWTGLPLEDAMSEQPIRDVTPQTTDAMLPTYITHADPGDEDQPIVANTTQNAATMTTGGPATAIRYGRVASWDDYLVACQERDRLASEREAFLAALEEAIVGTRAEVEDAGSLVAALAPILRWAREDAAIAMQEDRDQARADLAALRPLVRALIQWSESDWLKEPGVAFEAGARLGETRRALPSALRAWALEGE